MKWWTMHPMCRKHRWMLFMWHSCHDVGAAFDGTEQDNPPWLPQLTRITIWFSIIRHTKCYSFFNVIIHVIDMFYGTKSVLWQTWQRKRKESKETNIKKRWKNHTNANIIDLCAVDDDNKVIMNKQDTYHNKLFVLVLQLFGTCVYGSKTQRYAV